MEFLRKKKMNKELYNIHVSDVLFLIHVFTFSQTLLLHLLISRLLNHRIHPSIHFLRRRPDFPLPGHIIQLLREDPKVFPGQPSDIVTPACPGSSSGSPPGGACQEHPRGRHPGGIQYRCPPGWWSSSPKRQGSALPPCRGNSFRPLVSGI